MPISPPIIMHTSNPVYRVRKISFFIFKFGAAGLNQAKLADLWPEEGDFTEHVDWIWSVHCDWGTNWHLWWNARLKSFFRHTLVCISNEYKITMLQGGIYLALTTASLHFCIVRVIVLWNDLFRNANAMRSRSITRGIILAYTI